MASISGLGFGVGIDPREIITIFAIVFLAINIGVASNYHTDLPSQIIVGILNSLVNFKEEYTFNWFESSLENIPLLSNVGSILDNLIDAVMNLEIEGIKIIRILAMGTIWFTALNIALPSFATIHGYESRMMGM